MITGGRNTGRVGTIMSRERHPGSFDIVHVKDVTPVGWEPSCPVRDIPAHSTLSTSRTPTATSLLPELDMSSSSARATSLTSPFPRLRVSSSPSLRRETRDLADLKLSNLIIIMGIVYSIKS